MFVLDQELQGQHCEQTANFTDNHLLHRRPGQVAAIISYVSIEQGLQLGGENSLFVWQEISVAATAHACTAMGQQAGTHTWLAVYINVLV